MVIKQLRKMNKPCWTLYTCLCHFETTGGTKIEISESVSTLDVPCVFVPKSPFLKDLFNFRPPDWILSSSLNGFLIAILHLITNN